MDNPDKTRFESLVFSLYGLTSGSETIFRWSKVVAVEVADRDTTEEVDFGDSEVEKYDVIDLILEIDRCRFKSDLFTDIGRWRVICWDFSVNFTLDVEDSSLMRGAGMLGSVALTEAGSERTCAVRWSI